jgi:NADH dehydrogenase (ubiquinone) 1 alpha subcomplex subunit 13
LAVYAGMFTYGFYQIGKGNHERRALKEEKESARAVIVPYLQAEEDRRYVKAWEQKKANDAVIMAGVAGFDADERPTSRWMPPGWSTRPNWGKS